MEKFKAEYIAVRAFNQAYMESKGITYVDLYRGVGGKTGKNMAISINTENKMKRTIFSINDREISGYTNDKFIADSFGSKKGGVTIKTNVPKERILFHTDLFANITDKCVNEKEFILFSGKQTVPVKDISF